MLDKKIKKEAENIIKAVTLLFEDTDYKYNIDFCNYVSVFLRELGIEHTLCHE